MLKKWRLCKVLQHFRKWGSIPEDVYLNDYVTWGDVLKSYKKPPTEGDLKSIFRIYYNKKEGYYETNNLT